MTDKDIHDALERIQPDDGARERMLQNILRSAKPPARKKHRIRRTLLLAAAVAAGLSAMAAAYGTDFFGLWSVGIRDQDIYSPVLTDDGYMPSTAVVDMVSLQGLAGSPEYQASVEWEEFWWEYVYDGENIPVEDEGIPIAYDSYGCYDTVMREKVDELCERYDLALLGASNDAFDAETLFEDTGTGDICAGTVEGGENQWYWGYWYDGGSLFFEGGVEWDNGAVTDYQFKRAVKGYFSSGMLNVGDLDEYVQWEYTTENGVPLLLALGSSKGLIFADREASFVSVNVLGDYTNIPEDIPENWEKEQFQLTQADMEALAEAFDFSVIP